jgi:CspA family cold shock protein
MGEVGVVKWFNEKKGIGFIVNSRGEDVFCHYSDVVGEGFKTLKEGEKVQFKAVPGSKGLKATEISVMVAG